MSGARLNLLAEVFTTGQVAKLCHVAPRTVSLWFDRGILRGYRIPGSRDRRVPRNSLLSFLREQNMWDIANRMEAADTVLFAGVSDGLRERLHERIGVARRVAVVTNLFGLGLAVHTPPRAAVVDLTVGADRNEVRAAVAKLAEVCPTVVVLLAEDDPEPVRVAYQGGVFEGVHLVGHPVDADAVARLILGGDA